MITDKKLYVMSVPRKSVQGRNNYTVELNSGRQLYVGRSRARGVQMPFGFVKDENGSFVTGMDKLVNNPFYQQEINELPPHLKVGSYWIDKYDSFKERERIDIQTLLEILDNVEAGTYTARSGMPMMTMGNDKTAFREMKSTFFDNFHVYLSEGTNVFTGETTRGRLGILICENHPKIAPSKDTVNEDFHEYYIGEAEESIKEQNREIDLVIQGLGNLAELKKNYDTFTQYQIATVLKLVRGDTTEAMVENQLKGFLWEQKKNKYGTQDERIRKFNALFTLLQENRDLLYIKYLVRQGLNIGSVFYDKGYYFWKTQKGRENLYKHYNEQKLETLLYNHLQDFDPSDDMINHFKEFEDELRDKGVRCR